MRRTILFFTYLFMVGCSKEPVNVYESEEFKKISPKDLVVGESVWVTTCFRCHMYGSMGGASVLDKVHFDKLSAKGFDHLYSSVLNGLAGEKGVMPPKGSCYSCSKDELKKAVYYIFHLAQIVQEAEIINQAVGEDEQSE